MESERPQAPESSSGGLEQVADPPDVSPTARRRVGSGPTLELIDQNDLDELGVTAKRVRKQVFAARPHGVPADLTMYRLRTRSELPGDDDGDEK